MMLLVSTRFISFADIPIFVCSLHSDIEKMKHEQEKLKKEVESLRFEKDVLETTLHVLKKAGDITLETLTNKEKAEVIDVLRRNYRLKVLLKRFCISKSSYFYTHNTKLKPDKYANLREEIHSIFNNNHKCYGYRRIYIALKRKDIIVSEKVIRRLMSEEHLLVYKSRYKKYKSYIGEISTAPENIVKRKFKADEPNKLWLTDITEFPLPAGKVYLSPIIDCYDGMVVSWSIGRHPTAELANTMLENAIKNLPYDKHPIIHSDRGGHYRWPQWIATTESAGLIRSMSRKGCSQDNSACEGFFGRLKNEMFYGVSWLGVSIDDFIKKLDNYINWYNNSRLKISLGGMSPIEYRKSCGIR